jgi:hypothetical protein
MSKTIVSPVKRWPGTVRLSDPLTFPQVFAFQDSIEAAKEADSNVMQSNAAWLPGILACVEAWELDSFPKNPTPESWPATPPASAARLIAWLIGEIGDLFAEAEPDPNE